MDGGLGFKDLELLNISLLAKQAWGLYTNGDSLWARILKSIYFQETDFLEPKVARGSSWAWASLMEGRDFLMKNANWSIGDDHAMELWDHNWVSGGGLLGSPNVARRNSLRQTAKSKATRNRDRPEEKTRDKENQLKDFWNATLTQRSIFTQRRPL